MRSRPVGGSAMRLLEICVGFGSLRIRLLLAAAISILVALALAAAGLAWLYERHVERWLDAELEVQLDQLVGGIQLMPSQKIEVVKPPSNPRFEQPLWRLLADRDGA